MTKRKHFNAVFKREAVRLLETSQKQPTIWPGNSDTGYDNAEQKASSVRSRTRSRTRDEARTEIFEYIELFYNRKRLYQSLKYQPPMHYKPNTCRLINCP